MTYRQGKRVRTHFEINQSNSNDDVRNCKIDNDLKHVSKFFKSINRSEKPLVVMESSSVWYNIYHHLSEERKLDVGAI